jgi:hypothetical protein
MSNRLFVAVSTWTTYGDEERGGETIGRQLDRERGDQTTALRLGFSAHGGGEASVGAAAAASS